VGELQVVPSAISVAYRLDEPVQLKITLQGKGNFTEINTLPLILPPKAEIISVRTATQNGFEIWSKTFEYSLLLKAPPPATHELGRFIYFDPRAAHYQTLNLPRVAFSQAEGLSKEQEESFQLPPHEMTWVPTTSLEESLLFWAIQVGIGAGLIVFSIQSALKLKTLQKMNSPDYQRQQGWKKAVQAQSSGDSTQFVQIATALFTQFLREKNQRKSSLAGNYPTKKQILSGARPQLSPEEAQKIETLFEHYDQLYSPAPNSPPSETLLNDLAVHLKVSHRSK
jgi:hypothetical protein